MFESPRGRHCLARRVRVFAPGSSGLLASSCPGHKRPMPPRLFIDADACPVKDECYRVAERCGLRVFVVSNGWINTRRAAFIEQVVVDAPALQRAVDRLPAELRDRMVWWRLPGPEAC